MSHIETQKTSTRRARRREFSLFQLHRSYYLPRIEFRAVVSATSFNVKMSLRPLQPPFKNPISIITSSKDKFSSVLTNGSTLRYSSTAGSPRFLPILFRSCVDPSGHQCSTSDTKIKAYLQYSPAGYCTPCTAKTNTSLGFSLLYGSIQTINAIFKPKTVFSIQPPQIPIQS